MEMANQIMATRSTLCCAATGAPRQVSACRAALALYRERMEVVMAERSRLTERLADSMAGLRLGTEHEGWLQVAASNVEKTSVEAAAAAAGLDENVAAEGRATKIAKVGGRRVC